MSLDESFMNIKQEMVINSLTDSSQFENNVLPIFTNVYRINYTGRRMHWPFRSCRSRLARN